jgi:hypothetical protein
MKRLSISANYIGSSIIASLLVVVAITNNVSEDARTAFFIFQAVLFPLIALLGQTKILMMYKGQTIGRLDFIIDILVCVMAFFALKVIGRDYFDLTDLVLYSVAIPLTYRLNIKLAEIQQSKADWVYAYVPILVGVVRVGAIFTADTERASVLFLLSAGFAFLVAYILGILLKSGAGTKQPDHAQKSHLFAILVFFIISSFTFQWDRYVLSFFNLEDFIVASGITMLWVLSPVSAIYSIIYRAEASGMFVGKSAEAQYEIFKNNMNRFLILIGTYSVFLVILWYPLNRLAFPYFEAPLYLPLILVLAISLDRLGYFVLFILVKPSSYLKFAIMKLFAILCGVAFAVFLGDRLTLLAVFLIYLFVSIAHFTVGWRLRSK